MDVRLLGGFAVAAASYMYYQQISADQEAARQLVMQLERPLEMPDTGARVGFLCASPYRIQCGMNLIKLICLACGKIYIACIDGEVASPVHWWMVLL